MVASQAAETPPSSRPSSRRRSENQAVLDSATGEEVSWKGRKWLVSEHTKEGELVQTFLKAALTALEHELREGFRYCGRAIFDPHLPMSSFLTVAEAAGKGKRNG